jgi:tetratricopeptide (TPR) repeat protein
LQSWQQALEIYREIGDRAGEGNALSGLGLAYHSLGQYQRAIEFSEQALAIFRDIGDRAGEGTALGNLGVAYRNLGQSQRAIEFHEQDLAISHCP